MMTTTTMRTMKVNNLRRVIECSHVVSLQKSPAIEIAMRFLSKQCNIHVVCMCLIVHLHLYVSFPLHEFFFEDDLVGHVD